VIAASVVVVSLVIGAVDVTSARAIAHRNEVALTEGEAALARGDAALALDRALAVDVKDRRLVRARLLLLRGRARARLGLVDDAVGDLRAAGTASPMDAPARVGLTRELAALERARGGFDACADDLATIPATALQDDDAVLLATCLRGTTRAALAHDALAGRSGATVRALRARVRLEDGLPVLAREDVGALVATLDAAELLAFARAFRAAGDVDYARALIDVAVARFPDDADVARALAATDDGGARAGRASLVVDRLADRLRADGRTREAWATLLADQGVDRLRVRFALLVDDRSWDRVLALAPRLRAAGVFDDDVAYAVAYAALHVGRLEDADAALDVVTGATAFARATELRGVIAACRAAKAAANPEEQERTCPR
jgi:tetratricopeptide (TPR) repeat protein